MARYCCKRETKSCADYTCSDSTTGGPLDDVKPCKSGTICNDKVCCKSKTPPTCDQAKCIEGGLDFIDNAADTECKNGKCMAKYCCKQETKSCADYTCPDNTAGSDKPCKFGRVCNDAICCE